VVAIVDYVRTKQRRGVYLPPVYVVKEDGDTSLRMWAMSMLVMDRADVLPGYQQWVNNLRERVCGLASCLYVMDANLIYFT
jgi:protein transport protein SEC24